MDAKVQKEGSDLPGWRLRAARRGAGEAGHRPARGGPRVQRLRRVLRYALWFSRRPREE